MAQPIKTGDGESKPASDLIIENGTGIAQVPSTGPRLLSIPYLGLLSVFLGNLFMGRAHVQRERERKQTAQNLLNSAFEHLDKSNNFTEIRKKKIRKKLNKCLLPLLERYSLQKLKNLEVILDRKSCDALFSKIDANKNNHANMIQTNEHITVNISDTQPLLELFSQLKLTTESKKWLFEQLKTDELKNSFKAFAQEILRIEKIKPQKQTTDITSLRKLLSLCNIFERQAQSALSPEDATHMITFAEDLVSKTLESYRFDFSTKEKLARLLPAGYSIPTTNIEPKLHSILIRLIDITENASQNNKMELFETYNNFLTISKNLNDSTWVQVVNEMLENTPALGLPEFANRSQRILGDALSKEKMVETQEAAKSNPLFFLFMSAYYDFIEGKQNKKPIVEVHLQGLEVDKKFIEFNSYFMVHTTSFPPIGQGQMNLFLAAREITLGMNSQGIDQSFAYLVEDINQSGFREAPRYDYEPNSFRVYWEYSHQMLPIDQIKDVDDVTLHRVAELDIIHPQTLETSRISIPFPFQGKMTKEQARVLITLMRNYLQSPAEFDIIYQKLEIQFSQIPEFLQNTIIAMHPLKNREEAIQLFFKEACEKYYKEATQRYVEMCADFSGSAKLPKRWRVLSEPAIKTFIESQTDETAIKGAALCHTFREDNRFFLLPLGEIKKSEQKEMVSLSSETVNAIATQLAQTGEIETAIPLPTRIDKDQAVIEGVEARFTLKPDDDGRFPKLLKFTITIDTEINGKPLKFIRYKYYNGTNREAVIRQVTESRQLAHDLVRWKGEAIREIFPPS